MFPWTRFLCPLRLILFKMVQIVTEGILQSVVRIVSELEAGDDDEVHGDLDQDQRQEPEDALAAHHLQRVRVVLGDELLLVHKLARGDNLPASRYLSKQKIFGSYLTLIKNIWFFFNIDFLGT